MRLGITIPFDPFTNTHFPELVRTADRCGYTDAWSYESFSSDAFAPIAAAAMLTDKMRFGCAIIPVFTRPAPLIAMSAVTVNELAGGRFILGLGISTPNIVEQWMGVPFQQTGHADARDGRGAARDFQAARRSRWRERRSR